MILAHRAPTPKAPSWLGAALPTARKAMPHRDVDATLPDWKHRTRTRAESTAARCSANAANAPRVAFCVAGAARSFATPLVLHMLRHNLYGALAGAPGSKLFLQLKQLDSDKRREDVGGQPTSIFSQHNETTVAHLLAALATPWLRAATGEAVIVDGNGAYLGGTALPSSGTGGAAASVVAPEYKLWQQYRATRCASDASSTTRCCHASGYMRSGNNEERMLLHHLGLAWCRGTIARYEQAAGSAFDMVVYSRPDLVWWKPILPWCELQWRRQIIACREPGCDMSWLAPRQAADVLMRTAEIHRDCAKNACCSTSEYLLWLAQAEATRKLGVSVNMSIGKALLYNQDAYNGPKALSLAAQQPTSLLRSVKSVCRLAFDRAFAPGAKVERHTKDAFKYIPYRGLPISTIASLRRLMNNSRGACEVALAWVH